MTTENIVLLIVAVLGFIGAAIPGFMAWREGKQNAKAIQELHVVVNSRLSQLIEVTGAAKFAEGKIEERGIVHQETDASLIQAKQSAKTILNDATIAAKAMLDEAALTAKTMLVHATEVAKPLLVVAAEVANLKLEEAKNETVKGEP